MPRALSPVAGAEPPGTTRQRQRTLAAAAPSPRAGGAEEGAAPRTSTGRCRRHRLGSRLQRTPLHATCLLHPHTREGAPTESQPRAPRTRPSAAPRLRPFSLDLLLPGADAEEGREGGTVRHEDTKDQSQCVRATAAAPPLGRAVPPPSRVGGARRPCMHSSRAVGALGRAFQAPLACSNSVCG